MPIVKISLKRFVQDFRDVLNDVTLYCGGQKVSANRLVLCACSQVCLRGPALLAPAVSFVFRATVRYARLSMLGLVSSFIFSCFMLCV